MNPEIKKRWVEALRSGEYKQGKYALKKDDAYCCLGVLCDLAEDEGIVDERENGPTSPNLKRSSFWKPSVLFISVEDDGDFSATVLPSAVEAWAGIETDDPAMDKLIESNDEGQSFSYIADMIEEQL